MPLTVEDGTGMADASTFATRAEFIEYAATRGTTIPDQDSSDVPLVNAMDWFAAQDWMGVPINYDQGTPFPRTLYDEATDELAFPNDAVPASLKKAQLVLALASHKGTPLLAAVTAGMQLKRRKVGPMEREYFEGGSVSTADIPGVEQLLAGYIYNPVARIGVTRA